MPSFEYVGSATSSASPEEVWHFLSNPALWGEWWEQWDGAEGETPLQAGGVVKVAKVDLDPESATARGRETDRFPMEVLEAEAPSRLAIQNNFIGKERFVFTVTPTDGGSEIEYRREAEVPRLFGLLGKAMRGRLEKEAAQTAANLAAAASG